MIREIELSWLISEDIMIKGMLKTLCNVEKILFCEGFLNQIYAFYRVKSGV